jgi:hypothetical protein
MVSMRSKKLILSPVCFKTPCQNSSSFSLLTSPNFIFPMIGNCTGAVMTTLLRG